MQEEEVTAGPPRTLPQNARMWAMLTDLSNQLPWPVDGEMQWLSKEDWKVIISAWVSRPMISPVRWRAYGSAPRGSRSRPSDDGAARG